MTGASSGIGRATALLLAKAGAKIALVARSKDKLEKISQEIPDSLVVVCDMSKEDEVRRMIKKVMDHFGKIDILINNAAQGYDVRVEKIDTNSFRQIFHLNLMGPLVAMQQVIPLMKKQKSGTIVNISSGTALLYLPKMSAYSSLKRALMGLSLTAREELKKDNIVVSVVYPYITLTDFEKNTLKDIEEAIEQEGNDRPFHPPDTADHVAGKIMEVIENEEPEIFAHDWMKSLH